MTFLTAPWNKNLNLHDCYVYEGGQEHDWNVFKFYDAIRDAVFQKKYIRAAQPQSRIMFLFVNVRIEKNQVILKIATCIISFVKMTSFFSWKIACQVEKSWVYAAFNPVDFTRKSIVFELKVSKLW